MLLGAKPVSSRYRNTIKLCLITEQFMSLVINSGLNYRGMHIKFQGKVLYNKHNICHGQAYT